MVQNGEGVQGGVRVDKEQGGTLSMDRVIHSQVKMKKINLDQVCSAFTEYWHPKIAGELNGSYIKLAKLSGQFDWHYHEDEDEFFLIVSGKLRMHLRSGDVDLDPGEFIVVPKGTEHCPETLTKECSVMMIEPKGTLNTGNLLNEHTVKELDWV